MKTYGDRSFSACAPKLWNQPQDNIRAAGSVAIFKRQLETHLFKELYIQVLVTICSKQSYLIQQCILLTDNCEQIKNFFHVFFGGDKMKSFILKSVFWGREMKNVLFLRPFFGR